jgi:transcriptional regulator with XRE-family HTH domain
MTPPDQGTSGPTVLRIMLGAHLRRLREEAGIDMERAGRRIRGSKAKISRIELGQVSLKPRDIADLLRLYGVTDKQQRAEFMALVEQANQPGWWQRFGDVLPSWFSTYVGLEAAAAQIRVYEAQVIPGLLQTEDYARAILTAGQPGRTSEDIEQQVTLRLTRQRILTRTQPAAPIVWAVINEEALRRPVGRPAVLRAQLEHLIKLTELPNLTIQVLPMQAGVLFAHAGFTILRFAEPELPDVVYAEQLTSALYLDKPDDVEQYVQARTNLSVASSPPAAAAEVLGRILQEVPPE